MEAATAESIGYDDFVLQHLLERATSEQKNKVVEVVARNKMRGVSHEGLWEAVLREQKEIQKMRDLLWRPKNVQS